MNKDEMVVREMRVLGMKDKVCERTHKFIAQNKSQVARKRATLRRARIAWFSAWFQQLSAETSKADIGVTGLLFASLVDTARGGQSPDDTFDAADSAAYVEVFYHLKFGKLVRSREQ